jgi:hypothetical protein
MTDDEFLSRRYSGMAARPATNDPDADFLTRRYDSLAAQQQNRTRTVIETALRDDPELAAERRRLSQTSGLAPDVVQRNLEELRIKEKARAVDLARMAQDSPILYRQLVDPNFTTTAVDDLGALGNLERSVGRTVNRAMRYATGRDGLARDLGGAAIDVGLGATSGVGEMVFNVAGTLYDLVGWQSGAKSIRGMANRSKEARDSLGLQPESGTGQAAKSGFQSSGTSLAILPLGISRALFATANQAANAVAGIMSAGVGADAYLRSREKGRTQFESLRYAIPEGAFEFVFERIPASKLFGDIAANTGLLKLLGRQAISEGWTEQLTTLSQDFNEWMNLNPDKTLAEFIGERPEAAYQTFIATLVGVGVQTTTIRGIDKVVQYATNESLSYERDALRDQMALASQSALRTRSPEQFRAHVQRVVEENEGVKQELYVDAQVLNQLPQELLAQLPEAVRAALPEALDANSTVAIPMADVLTLAPGTELEQILNDNARVQPDAASRVEAQLAAEMIAQEADRVMQQASDQAAWQQSSAGVQQTILEQLNATGRFTPDVNEAYSTLQANFFSTMAARVGITPQEMYERYALKVAGQQVGRGEVLTRVFDQQVLADLSETVFVPQSKEEKAAGYANRFKNPVTLQDGTRLSGFTDPVNQTTFHGYTAAGDRITIRRDRVNPADIVSSRDSNRTAERLRAGLTAVNSPGGVLNQTPAGSAVDRLQMVAERGAREKASRSVISADERSAIAESARALDIPAREIEAAVREHKLAHPVAQGWEPLVYKRTVRDDAGKIAHEYQKVSYSFSNDSAGKQHVPGSAAYNRRVGGIAQGMVEEVRSIFRRAATGDKNAQNILAQAGWYKQMRSRLRQEFGGLGDLFADLLGATSPNTPVRDNWTNAIDSLRRASAGEFDALIPQWEAWADRVDALELQLRGFVNAQLEQGLTKKAIKALPEYQAQLTELKGARKLGDELLPTKESGKKYGFNGRNVARAMVDLWRVVKNADPDIGRGGTAPKALNFSGNLIGFRERATIDVWAARMLQRLAGGRRIPSMAETGVTGEMREDGSTTLQFGFGQDAFSEAVKRIRADNELVDDQRLAEINDDDLQAVVWFVEKELWTVNNWTNAAGEGGSFELEANLTGPADQARVRALRKTLDSSKSTPDAKAAARAELAGLERTVDRFVGGLSIQMSMDTQGVDFVPTDADMARLANQIRTAIYDADDGVTVLGSKTLSTEGRYGGVERSLDLEVVAREGYDANTLWSEMLRQAQAAKQDSTFLSRVLREGEDVDYLRHRPGVEIYFRDAAAAQQLDGMLAELATEGVEFLTVVVDGRRLAGTMAGAMPAAVGVRLQYVPEFEQRYGMDDFTGLDDAAIAAKMRDRAVEMERLAARVVASVEGVSFAAQFWYDTQVAFEAEYQEKIDALATGTAERIAGATGAGVWSGQSVRAGLEGANRQLRETASREPGGDVLGGDALGTGPEGLLEQGAALEQPAHGTFSPDRILITLGETADLSTFLHESGHFFLEVMADLASQVDAPAQIQADMAQVLEWFGVPDLATWNGYTLDQKRPYHERWAESFEQYLFEGKAPSAELQPLFRRFRSWLINVYRSLESFMRGRDLKVSDEIRQVMGRLIATDEQIAQAEESAGLLPDFDATNEAIEQLQSRSLRDLKWTVNARNKTIKALQKEAATLRKGVEAEVRAEVEQQPIYRAMRWLKRGETVDENGDLVKAEKGFRLSTEALAELYPESMLARPDLTQLRGMTAKEGLHPDLVADMFGFRSGDQLVREILAAEPIGSVIEGMTDQRMLERHGDLATPEAIEAAANEAVHNEARARSLATELKSQSEMMGERQDTGRTASNGRPITVNAIVAAAKQFALDLASRRRIKDLKNAAWQHRAAEARAGKAWQAATAKGETEAAVQAKRDQLLNNYAAKALQEAQAEVADILAFFRRVTTGSNETTVKKGRDPDVVNAARAILAAYGIAPRLEKGALEYLAVLEGNDPSMFAALQPPIAGAVNNAKPVAEMSVEELRGLRDEIDAMWHLAKRSRQMEIDGNLLDIEEAAEQLRARMQESGVPDSAPGEASAITPAQARGRWLQTAASLLRRVEQWAEGMDGAYGGPFLRLVFQPVKEAANRYRADRVKYRQAYQALVDQVAPALRKGPIAAPELGYTFGLGHNGIGHAELLHAVLHTGNESNKRKLLLGRRWATENEDGTLDTSRWDAFVDRMHSEGILGKAHYDFAQGVWDLLEQTKPLAQKTHREVFGRYFAEVTADEVATPFGTYRGGYVPAQADPRIVQDADLRKLAEAENENMAYAFPSTNRGFTKGRTEYNRPLLLDLRTIGQHIDKVLLFGHMESPVRDVQRLLSQKEVSRPLGRIDPTIYAGMLTPWLGRSARQIVETPIVGDGGISRVLSAARSRAGMALMFANISNSLQQLTGFSNAFAKLKSDGLESQMMRATAQFIANPREMSKSVAGASLFMEGRMANEIAAINDAMDAILLDPSLYEKGQAWTRKHAYFMQMAFANTMEPIIWTAGYNGALEKGMSEKDAVRYADGLIRQTQGSTLPEDVSRMETGPAYARVFTQFIGYFNMMANTNGTGLKQLAQKDLGLARKSSRGLLLVLPGMLIPLWIAEAIAQAMRGGPGDEDDDGYLDEWLSAVFGMGTIKGMFAMVPFVGQLANAAINRANSNPADDRISLSPAVSLLEAGAGVPALAFKAITDPESINKRNAVRDVASAVSIATGLPIYALARPLGYLAGMDDDRIDPTGPVDMVRGLLSGSASPESTGR